MKRTIAAGIMVFGALTGCSSETTTSSPGTPTDGGGGGTTTTTVTISSNQFSPATVTIKAGETVKWTWSGGTHNVVSGTSCTSDNKFTSGAPASAPNTFEHKFDTAGTYDYFCQPHCSAGMKGQVIVQ